VGVFFGEFSKRNLAEAVPRQISIADQPTRLQEITTDRMEIWSVIRALDKVLEMVRGQETLGWRSGRPTKVAKGLKEVVIMMDSDYLIDAITQTGYHPWIKDIRDNSEDDASDSTLASASPATIALQPQQQKKRLVLFSSSKKGKKVKDAKVLPRDYDLFQELDQMTREVAREGILVYFWRIAKENGNSSRLAKEGSVKGRSF